LNEAPCDARKLKTNAMALGEGIMSE